MGTAWRDGGGGDAAATAANTAAGNTGKRPGWQFFLEVDVDMVTDILVVMKATVSKLSQYNNAYAHIIDFCCHLDVNRLWSIYSTVYMDLHAHNNFV